jgi:hypothetical protein
MKHTFVTSAVLGMLAGAVGCTEVPAPQVPGAPAADPEGATVIERPQAAPAPAEKMACNAEMMKGAAPPAVTPTPPKP